jgi:hypothetical protein
LSANYVKKLDVQQLLPPVRETPKGPDFDDASDTGSDAGDEPECDHFNFAPVLKQLTSLEELHLTYGVSDCGMNFEYLLFQVQSVQQLTAGFSQSTSFSSLFHTVKHHRFPIVLYNIFPSIVDT